MRIRVVRFTNEAAQSHAIVTKWFRNRPTRDSELREMLPKLLLRFFGGLRFPWLFAITAALFGFDLIVPDFVPFADELLLGLGTLVLAGWKSRKNDARTIDAELATSDESAQSAAG